ncbi:unnamed protein product [Hyaloperonospora brassicae]|uniref:FHA domain-containing protein n=1 Tax=Hyaloperonospora brassicae TaxID=162125 RepID=A0AAV0U9C7_HYABA|nr:unnamed protein product [Hyaloperonospora brassicae]
MDSVPKRRKRPRDDTDGQDASSPPVPSATVSGSDSQLHLPATAAGDESDADCGRVSETRKTRRGAQAQDAMQSHVAVTGTALPHALSPVSRRVTSDTEAARTPSQAFVAATTGPSGYTSPVGAPIQALSQLAAAVALYEQQRSSPGAIDRVATNAARGVSPMRRVEKQLQFEGALPKLSQLLGPLAHDGTATGIASGIPTVRPCAIPTATSAAVQPPAIEQLVKERPLLFVRQQCGLGATEDVQTPLLEASEVLPSASRAPLQSGHTDDVSSDEELIGIPDPDIPDLDVSFSQERLEELSVTEKDLEESTVFTLCDGLTKSLSKVERDRMDLLNLLTIRLVQQSSPVVLGRSQFQEVFGDSIRGAMLSRLSRQHCMIHVNPMSSHDGSPAMGVTVRIQDMSTNGIWVNGKQLKNGQTHELGLGDIVTLLKIHQDEDDVSLEYKLVRSQSPPEHTKKIGKKSRRDGRFVKPSDNFSEASNAKTSQEVSVLSRHIRCTALFADRSAQHLSESSHPLEEADYDHREELSEVLSVFAQIPTFDASSSHRATMRSIDEALHDSSDVIFYIGGGNEGHLVIDAPNGLSACLDKYDLSQLFSVKSAQQKLIIVIAPSREPACLLAECGASHVCYLRSASKHSLRVAAFIRSLFAGLLKGFDVKKSYMMAEFVALNDLLPIMRPSEQICEMLPPLGQHSVLIGSPPAKPAVTDKNVTILLNGQFIPVLSAHFLGRDVIVSKIKSALTQKVRVCNVYGARGVGKTSIAVHVSKTLYRSRSYQNGVHYFAVNKLVEYIQNGITSTLVGPQRQGSTQLIQQEDALEMVMRDVEGLLRSLPATGIANHLSTLVVLDGCDVVLSALEMFVLNTVRAFSWVQILLTSTEKLHIDGGVLPTETICIDELGKLDCAKLFFRQARGHLTSRQIRQHSSIEALSEDERLLGTNGNPFRVSRLVYELESQWASSRTCN